ncbi:MAG: MjaI family restriction endonuclease [Candidatus Aminicenantes bacterium]|nr:MjaI family restriction endonuclease [Candidatus Aminicenantes bacterium]
MAKEWILNIATNRWGLNKKNNVGPVALWIRECHPKSISDWENYYFQKLRDFLEEKGMRFAPDEYIKHLGQKLYIKISETLSAEINEVTEADCVDYIRNLLINRTYEGYQNEVKTIYGYLENVLGVKIHPAPDKWDRLYNVDFYIKTSDKLIGLQIKPLTYEQLPEVHKWREWLERTHDKFKKEQGGDVFIIFTTAKDKKKLIHNIDVLDKIKRLL